MTPRPTVVEISNGAAIRLIAGREISTRVRSKAFVWTTVALVAAVVLGGVLLHFVGSQSDTAQQVGVTPEASGVAEQLVATRRGHRAPRSRRRTSRPTEAGEALLKDGDLERGRDAVPTR